MLVLYPFCAKEKEAAVRLAEWIVELGGVSAHDCLLEVHADTDSTGVIEPLRAAFKRVAEFAVTDKMSTDRSMYVWCANMMWKRAAKHVAAMNEPMPWLWIEMDAVPLVPEWLDWLAAEYAKAGKPFLHHLTMTQTGSHNSGLGVYPARVSKYTNRLWELANSPWDVFLSPDFMPHTHHTELIHEIFYEEGWDGPPPTFPDAKSLARIKPEAVLYHRCKDGSLIQRLREAKGSVFSGFVNTIETESRGGVSPTHPVHRGKIIGSSPIPATPSSNGSSPKIIDRIREHVGALSAIVEEKPRRGLVVLEELRRAKLAPQARKRK